MIDGCSYCETMAAIGMWHIRVLTDNGRKISGGADSMTLCGLDAAWDVPSADVPFVFHPAVARDNHHGRTCRMCSAAYITSVNLSIARLSEHRT